ncbi:MAG: hypothetical protein Q7R57_03160 [Dehalococcoidales bacterium]|nr:hypothetical protein [Dehalococcoidales bacterium]
MSQLIEKLNRVAKPASQPLGFRIAQAVAPKAQMLLIARPVSAESLTGLDEADAVLLHSIPPEARALQKLAKSLAGIPWGIWDKTDEKELKLIVEAGGDFIVFPAAGPVAVMPQGNKLGKILQVESSLNEGLLRAINDLPVDAVLIADENKIESGVTWQQLMLYQRDAAMLGKPLLVSVAPDLSVNELQALWDIGVDGIVVEVSKGQTDKLSAIHRTIGNLTNNSARRKQGKTGVVVPTFRAEAPAEQEEPDEGDE